MPRVSMVFDEQNAQRFFRFSSNLRTHPALFRAVRDRVKGYSEGAAKTSTSALYFDRACMKTDEMPRNGQTQAQPAKLAPDGWISLFERREKRALPFDFNSDPVIGNLELKPTAIVIARADIDLSPGWCEFHGIVNQVPENLVDAYRIGLNPMLPGVQMRGNAYLLCSDA
jgi:hypothetical protein